MPWPWQCSWDWPVSQRALEPSRSSCWTTHPKVLGRTTRSSLSPYSTQSRPQSRWFLPPWTVSSATSGARGWVKQRPSTCSRTGRPRTGRASTASETPVHTPTYHRLWMLHHQHGARVFGKICQKLLAVTYWLAGFMQVVERGVQGVDVVARNG